MRKLLLALIAALPLSGLAACGGDDDGADGSFSEWGARADLPREPR